MLIDIVLVYAVGRGGLENVISKVYNGLVKKGHRVRVFQAYRPEYIEWERNFDEIYYYGEDIPFSMINSGLHQYAMKYRQAIEEKGRPDIVIATQSTSLSYICNVALNGKNYNVIPQISWLHGPVSAYGGRELLSFSNSHMALCNKLGDDLALALDRENIYVVGNPVQIKNVDVINRPKEILTILSLGRLSPEKDIETLINALAILKKPWRLIVVGDGGHYSTLRTLAEEKNINENIQWTGWHENPWDTVKEASVTVISSLYEGFSMTTAESLARGIPVVTTKCGGPEDMVVEGVNGWLYQVGDYIRLAEILSKIQDGKYILPKAEVCIDSIQKFDEHVVINKIEEVIIKTYYKFYGFTRVR